MDPRNYILAFKAGRAIRREGTNFVDPQPEKGAVILSGGDDDLMHFQWKNRTTDEIEEVRVSRKSFDGHSYDLGGLGFDHVPRRCKSGQSSDGYWREDIRSQVPIVRSETLRTSTKHCSSRLKLN